MISDEQLVYFCRNLSASVQSGLAISDSLETLSKGGDVAAKAAEASAEQILGGRTLHESLASQGRFPPVFVSLVRAGEQSGKLDQFLDRFVACLEARIEFNRRMKRALIYPAFVALLAATLFLLFSLKALPMIIEPFQDFGGTLPLEAMWLIEFGQGFSKHWQLALLIATAAALLLTAFFRSSEGRKTVAVASRWVPGLRFVTEHARQDLLLTTTGLLLESGLPAGAAMDVLTQLFEDDPPQRRRLSRAAAAITAGRSISESLGSLCCLGDRRGLEIAEKTGRLPQQLLALGKSHRDLQQHRLGIVVTASKIAGAVVSVSLAGALIWTVAQAVLSLLSSPLTLIRPG